MNLVSNTLKSILLACMLLFLFSCDKKEETYHCLDFDLAPCTVSDSLEIVLLDVMLRSLESPFYEIQLSQNTLRGMIYVRGFENCGFELDTTAINRYNDINAIAHQWCTELLAFDNVISREEQLCLYENFRDEDRYRAKYPNTRLYTLSRPVVDRFNRAYFAYDDGCGYYSAMLEFSQGQWQVVCTELGVIC